MKRMKRTHWALLLLAGMMTTTGCNVSAGWADGVSKGLSAAIQSLIAAAIAEPIATLFPQPPTT